MRRSRLGLLAVLALLAACVFAPAPALAAEEHCRDARGSSGVLDWGINGVEQLAAGFGSDYENAPQPVAGLSGATQVKAGYKLGLALLGNCTLKAWGGERQRPARRRRPAAPDRPGARRGLSEVKEIAVGNGHAMALLFNGTVWTWGASEFGERGNKEKGWERTARQNESCSSRATCPRRCPDSSGVVQIAAGGARDYALLSDGEVERGAKTTDGLLGVEEKAPKNSATAKRTRSRPCSAAPSRGR